MTDTHALIVVASVLAGLIVGSFVNVLIARVPEGRSIVRPGSRCGSCGASIRPRDNIPVLSWILLKARCRDCGAPISIRYPLVEVATGLLWGGLAMWSLSDRGVPGLLPLLLVLSAASVALTVIDVDVHRLPDAIVLPLYPLTVAGLVLAGIVEGDWPMGQALIGVAVWLLLIGGVWLISGGRGMGFGDVKLAPILGITLGWVSVGSAVVGLTAAFFFGALVGIVLMAARSAGRRSHIPFGPFLLGGALVGLVVGEAVWNAYVDLLVGS